jgi:endonuclease-3
MGREPEGRVEAQSSLVVPVHEEHSRADAPVGEVRQAGDDQRLPQPRTLADRVDADHEDLAELGIGVGRGVDLRPAEPGQPVGVEGEQEALRVEPRLGHAPFERRLHPPALFGMIGERPVVHGQPGGVVLSGHEGPHLQTGRPRRLLAEWQRDALLEEVPLVAEAGAGSGLVVGVVRFQDPEHDETTACSSDVVDGPVQQRNLDTGSPAYRGMHDHPGGPVGRGEGVAAVHVREADRPAVVGCEDPRRHRLERPVEVAPDSFAQGRMAVDCLDVIVQPGHRHEVGRRDGPEEARLDHPVEGTCGPRYVRLMARPRGAKQRAAEVVQRLAVEYPGSAKELCALLFDNAYQLLVATILSAQSTDETVNKITPAVFEHYPTPADLAHANPEELEELIHASGFFRSKSKSLILMARVVEERFGGEIPSDIDQLDSLPGVGRKTGNVVRSVAFGLPGLPVDTHVMRLVHRLKVTNETDPVKIELDLNGIVQPEERGALSLRLILHGRRVCKARKPQCDVCILNDICPSAFKV